MLGVQQRVRVGGDPGERAVHYDSTPQQQGTLYIVDRSAESLQVAVQPALLVVCWRKRPTKSLLEEYPGLFVSCISSGSIVLDTVMLLLQAYRPQVAE